MTNNEMLTKALNDPESGAYLIDQDGIYDVARVRTGKPARITWAVPDEFVKNLTGGHMVVDHYFMLMIPHAFVDKVLKENDNTILNEPGEVKNTEPTAQEE